VNDLAFLDHAAERVSLPSTYIAARIALAKCDRVDECLTYSSQAAALEAYAHQSRDTALMDFATRIQARAVRRLGELLKEIPIGGRIAAANASGLSRLQRNQASSIAQIAPKTFEQLVESKAPPKVYKLADIGRKRRPGTGMPTNHNSRVHKNCPTCTCSESEIDE
jgi:hypothetical protein